MDLNFYNLLLVASFLFFFEQISLLIVMYRNNAGWHFRFSSVEGYRNLNPIVATWKIASVIFLVTLVIIPIMGYLFSDSLATYANSLQYNFLIFISAFLGAFFFIWHYIVVKDWNKLQVAILTISLILFVLPFILTYGNFIHQII